jgi:hypothetical protein
MVSAITFKKGTLEKSAFIFLNLIDLTLTLWACTLGAQELNPVMRQILSNPLQLCVIKIFLPVFFAWIVPAKLLLPSIAILCLVISWNIWQLLTFFQS